MATISATIQLYDMVSAPMMSIINASTLCVNAIDDLSSAMDRSTSTAIVDSIQAQMQQATTAIQQARDIFQQQLPELPPITWQSPDMQVFTNTGIERYQQEVENANALLQQLSNTQSNITRQAQNTDIFPPNMIQDISGMTSRIQDIQDRIQEIQRNPLDMDTDVASNQIEHLRSQLIQAVNAQNALNDATLRMDVSGANEAYNRLHNIINSTERNIRDRFNQPPAPPPSPPVATWKSPAIQTFTNTGIERFRNEVQSTNTFLNQLNATQSRIASQAQSTNIFPANMNQDMSNMGSRMQAIQDRIQAIQNNPLNMGTDLANNQLEQLRSQLAQAMNAQNDLNDATQRMDVTGANEAYNRLNNIINSTERNIRDNTDEQGRFNQNIRDGTNDANNLMSSIKGIIAAYITVQSMGAVLNLSDSLTQTNGRLNLMNDGLQSTKQLNDMIFLSAENARGSYQATAATVSKLGLMAEDAFSSSAEIIAFSEQLNKQFKIAGTEAAGVEAAMLQLTQAMGSGVLRGEEYNSILEQAPNIIQSIADYLDVPKGKLKELASEGVITSEIVKNALFAAADETNAAFEQMPRTFEDVGTSIQNNAIMAFQPILEQINGIANSEAFDQMVNGIISGLVLVSGFLTEVFNMAVNIGGGIADNWSIISPILYGISTALGIYVSVLIIYNTIQAITNALTAMAAFQETVHAAATAMSTGATFAQTVAQYGLNAALLACPLTWIIIGLIAIVAAIYAAVAAYNKFAGTSVSATGIICGVIAVGAALIGNIFVALINFAIDIFVVLWNFIAAFANFFGNVFNDPVGSIARLFFDLVDTVLQLLESLASAIDTIFGSSLAGAVSGWRGSLGSWVDDTFGQGEEIMAQVNAGDYHINGFDYGNAWDTGYNFGAGVDNAIANFDPSSVFGSNIPNASDYANTGASVSEGYGAGSDLGGVGSGVDDIAGNTANIADAMDITNEELKYLRDIAEQETVNRFTTAEIKIEQNNVNNISTETDLNGLVEGITSALQDSIETVTEGVHK